MSWVRKVTYRTPKDNVQVENNGSSSSGHAKAPPKATPSIPKVQLPSSHVPQTWGIISIIGIKIPHGGLNKVISTQILVHWERCHKYKHMFPPRVHKS
jgi:hypothetical protein